MKRHPNDLTTDAQIDQALRRARTAKPMPSAVAAKYVADGLDAVLVRLADGTLMVFPRTILQGLHSADPSQLERIEILPFGSGIDWPDLDVAFHVPALAKGIVGNKAWMEALRRKGVLPKPNRSSGKVRAGIARVSKARSTSSAKRRQAAAQKNIRTAA